MQTFGKIEVILNEMLAIISSTEKLKVNEIITVFSSIDDPKLHEQGVSGPLLFPKGELKIVSEYAKNKYLAETFRETLSRTRKVTTPSPLIRSMAGVLAQLQPETKEIIEEIPGELSAQLNKSQSLDIKVSKIVSVGDRVGRHV